MTRARSERSCVWRAWPWLFVWLVVLVGPNGCGDDDDDDGSTPAARAPGAASPETAPLAPVAAVQTSEAWLDLVAQRPQAVVLFDERVWIDLGQEYARKHTALGYRNVWELGASVDGKAAGIVQGRTAALDIPLDGALAPALHPDTPEHPGLALAITVKPLVPDQKMTVLWNERVLAHLHLAEGWERRTLSLPADQVSTGENRLRLHFARSGSPSEASDEGELQDVSAAVSLVEVGAHAAISNRPPTPKRQPFVVQAGPREGIIELRPGASLVYYVIAARRSKLDMQVQGSGAIEVVASTDEDHAEGRAPRVLMDEPLRTTGHDAQLDLTGWGGQPLRIEIRARGSEPGSKAIVREARIVVRRSVPVDRRARRPRDIVILAVEGARADAFDRSRRPRLPNIEAFMEDALVFERAYALSPAAVPSHAALMSSVVPPLHLTVRGTFVADRQTLLAESLGRAGYFRVMATANTDVNEERGLLQGFDTTRVVAGAVEDTSARSVQDVALEAIRGHDERWLMYANVNDPQAPYEPSRELLEDVVAPEGAILPHLTHIWVGRVRMRKIEPSPEELAYVRRLYRGEIQTVDDALGRLLETLKDEKRLDDAIVVLMGVHGEEFFEHRGAGHGRTLYEESLRVPLMIRAPAVLEAGRVEQAVDLLDLTPTLADLVGLAPADTWQGASLVPVIDDPSPPPRLVVGYLGDGSRSALVGSHKLLLGPGRAERYVDLAGDAGEQFEAVASKGLAVPTGGIGLRIVRSALVWQLVYESRWRRARWGTGANLEPAFALDLGM